VYGRLGLKRVVHAELHSDDVKPLHERLGRERRGALEWIVVGVELGEPCVEAVAFERVPSVSSLVYGHCCDICSTACKKSRNGRWEWGLYQCRHSPLSALLPIFVSLRPYRSRCPALAPEMLHAQTAGRRWSTAVARGQICG